MTAVAPHLDYVCPSHEALDTMGYTAALKAVDRPAFLMCLNDGIVRSNAAGRKLLEHRPYLTTRDVQVSWWGKGSRLYTITPIEVESIAGQHALAVMDEKAAFNLRVDDISARFGFSDRQRHVFALLVEGRGNKDIAHALGCVVGTVELHVTAILGKTQFASRSEVIAKFYSKDWPR